MKKTLIITFLLTSFAAISAAETTRPTSPKNDKTTENNKPPKIVMQEFDEQGFEVKLFENMTCILDLSPTDRILRLIPIDKEPLTPIDEKGRATEFISTEHSNFKKTKDQLDLHAQVIYDFAIFTSFMSALNQTYSPANFTTLAQIAKGRVEFVAEKCAALQTIQGVDEFLKIKKAARTQYGKSLSEFKRDLAETGYTLSDELSTPIE